MTSLFSNLELSSPATDKRLVHNPGSVLGNAALIAGTTVGAGVLALPAVTYPAGVVPSTVLMVLAWLYMLVSGLLIAEANVRAMRETGRPDLGLLATIERSLGKWGAIAAGFIYLFIHYALLVAYMARGGDILASFHAIPPWLGHVIFAALLGGVLYVCSARLVEKLNTALVAAVIVTFLLLLALTVGQVEPARWQVQHWEAIGLAVPVMFVAFVYHNVVPVVTTQLEGDGPRVRQAIALGSLLPLVMFALWNAVILGSASWEAGSAVGELVDPIEQLRQQGAYPQLGVVVSVFSEVAIATSFIGFVFGLLNVFEDILAGAFNWLDTMSLDAISGKSLAIHGLKRPFFYGLTLGPPLVLSVSAPDIFYTAIDFAGAYGISILFGIIPAVMVWRGRYRRVMIEKGMTEQVRIESETGAVEAAVLVPGGRGLLIVMMGIAIAIIIQNVMLS